MKRLFFIIFSLTLTAAAQDIQSILDADPFDPMRGKTEGVETTEEEPVVVPVDLPVLDGTIIAGTTRIALFTYILEGKPTSARVKVDDKVAQYTVSSIERHKVELTPSGGEPIKLALYSGQKDKRGGSKVAPKARARVKKENGPAPPNLLKDDPTQPRNAERPAARNNNRKNNSTKRNANQRKPPRTPRTNQGSNNPKRF